MMGDLHSVPNSAPIYFNSADQNVDESPEKQSESRQG